MYTINVRRVIGIEAKEGRKDIFHTEAPFSMNVDSMQEFKVWAIQHMDVLYRGWLARNGSFVYYVRMDNDEVVSTILHNAPIMKLAKGGLVKGDAIITEEIKPVLCGNCSYWVEEKGVDEEGIEWKKNVHKKHYHISTEAVKECYAVSKAQNDSQEAEIKAELAVEKHYEERGAEVLFDDFEYGIEEYDEEPISLDD